MSDIDAEPIVVESSVKGVAEVQHPALSVPVRLSQSTCIGGAWFASMAKRDASVRRLVVAKVRRESRPRWGCISKYTVLDDIVAARNKKYDELVAAANGDAEGEHRDCDSDFEDLEIDGPPQPKKKRRVCIDCTAPITITAPPIGNVEGMEVRVLMTKQRRSALWLEVTRATVEYLMDVGVEVWGGAEAEGGEGGNAKMGAHLMDAEP